MNMVFARSVDRPLNQLQAPTRPPLAPVIAYGAGSILGGTAVALVAAIAGNVIMRNSSGDIHTVVLAFAIALGVWAVLAEYHHSLGSLPQRRAQVPRRWLAWGNPSRTAAAWGLMLGGGIFTYLHHATAYVVAILIVLAPSPLVGAALGAMYGVTRAIILFGAWVSGVPADGGAQMGVARQTHRIDTILPFSATVCLALALFGANPWF